MKSHSTILAAFACFTIIPIPLVAGPIAQVQSISASNGGDQYANGVTSLTDGSGIDKSANPNNPSLWVFSGSSYQHELMSWYWKSGGVPITGLNGKVAWQSFDLGSSIPLETLYLFNNNYQGGVSGLNAYNLYYSNSPTVPLPAAPAKNTFANTGLTPQGDYNFASGGWTLFNTSGSLAAAKSGISTVSLAGVTARYVAIEILSNHGDTYQGGRVGLDEVAFTQAVTDTDPPTLAPSAIVDNKSGGPVDVSTLVTYTLTFSEDINAGTVTSADFDNAGTSTTSIGAINETSPGVFTVQVTPTTVGTLQLRIPVSASITDVAGNPLNSNPAILDDTTLTVNADGTPPTLAPANIVDDRNGGPIAMNSIVIYTVTFSEDINSSTVSSSDFTNAGTSDITFGAINETFPGVFTIEVTPTNEGSLRLQIPAGATINDTASNPLNTGTAILDDTTITVQTSAPSALVGISAITGSHGGDQYANGLVSLTNGSGINKVNPNDPSTWTMNGDGYPEEWMATYLKVGSVVTPGLNGKVAWACLDFGSKTPLGMLYLFNTNYSGGISSTDQFNLYYADSPAVALPAQPVKGNFATTGLTPQADYNFSGGGWTLFNTTGPLAATKAGITSLNLPGVSARYLAIEILSNQGDPSGGGRVGFDEIAITAALPDVDTDGLPDAYELANTDPSSATALNPTTDYEPDGLTTWQEYVLGTNPNDPDTDDDNLNDGSETLGVASRPPTNPLLADTDGDGLSDLAESNTGVWSGAANPGTNPVNSDTDADGLNDKVETNTGTFVSFSNTGTSPLSSNSDGDNASDWYEVAIIDKNPTLAIQPNSPNDSALKPNIPYPLPDPDASTGATNKPVKVYIMSGQSNMVGFGQVSGTGPGTLQRMTTRENKFPNLVGPGGTWTTRNDVRYRGVVSDIGDGPLRADVAGGSFGPELGFGYVMGWYHDEPVLLIKSCIGNRSLMWDFAAPTTPSFDYAADGRTYAGYGQGPNSWLTATGAPSPFVWYAGKQFDDCFKKESDMSQLTWQVGIQYQADGNVGSQIRHNSVEYQCKATHIASAATEPGVGTDWATVWQTFSISNVADILDTFATEYAGAGKPFQGQDFEIAGFVWWQGYGDQGEPAATRYRANMARFIQQIRLYYEGRYPGKGAGNAPFVLATLATDGGWSNPNPLTAKVAQAQLDVVNDVPRVKTMEARSFWRDASISPSGQGYHYNWNAETYLLTGDALGRAMIALQSAPPPGITYANWIAGFPSVPSGLAGFDQDADGDGIDNGAENFFGTNPGVGNAGLTPGAASANTFTFTHPQNTTPATGVTAAYRWSKNLATFLNAGQTDGDGTTVSFSPPVTNAGITSVTATVTGTATSKLFVDVKVSQN